MYFSVTAICIAIYRDMYRIVRPLLINTQLYYTLYVCIEALMLWSHVQQRSDRRCLVFKERSCLLASGATAGVVQ